MRQWINVFRQRSDFRATLVNAGCRSGQTILLNALSIPATAFIIRKLGATGFGEWSTATALITTIGVVTNLGLRAKFVRHVAQNPTQASLALAEQLGARLILALAAGAAVLLVAFALRYPPVVLGCTAVAAIALLASTTQTTISDMQEAFGRFPTVAMAAFIGGVLLTVVSVSVVAVGGGAVALGASYIVGPVTTTVLLLFVLRRERFPVHVQLHPGLTVRHLWQSRHFATQQLLYAVSANVPLLMLPRLTGVERFGIYSAGVLLVTRLGIIPDAIGTAFYPLISRLITHDLAAARRQALRGLAVSLALCGATAALAVMIAGPLARILFPKSPDLCRQVIVLTIWSLPLIGLESIISYALNAIGREVALARASLLGAIINVSVGVALVSKYGVAGGCAYLLIRAAVQVTLTLPIFVNAFRSRETATPNRTRARTLERDTSEHPSAALRSETILIMADAGD